MTVDNDSLKAKIEGDFSTARTALKAQVEEHLLDIAMHADTSSPHDGAILFSGPKAKRKAKALAKSEGLQTVIDTPALQKFNENQSHFFGKDAVIDIESAYAIGDFISEKFAAEASGIVRIYLDGVKPHGTFARAELPALMANEKISGFLVYDSKPLAKDVEPFEEMQMNRETLGAYVAQKISNMPCREVGRASKAPAFNL